MNYPLPGTYFPSCLCSESPPRFEYLAAAHRAYSMSTGIAGISLQRQAGRMDAYPEELEGKRVRPGKNQPLAALKPTTYRDTLYLFPHVGSWGFSPEPKVWHDFLDWFKNLEDVDAPENWVTLVDTGKQVNPKRESLPSRWYRHALSSQRGELGISQGGVAETTSSMWTAHFDTFCMQRGLFTLHPHLFVSQDDGGDSLEVGLARSWREDGAHYRGFNTPDSSLLSLKAWRTKYLSGSLTGLFLPDDEVARLTHGGERLSSSDVAYLKRQYAANNLQLSVNAEGRRLFDLDVYWNLESSIALDDLTHAVNGNTFGYYNPLSTITQTQAHCILGGKSVAILGDSISRYFTYTFNHFLEHGVVAAEWGEQNGGCGKWGCGNRADGEACYVGPYFDCGTTWTDGTDRSGKADHRQHITATIEGGYGEIKTTFYFIQDTWYDALQTEAAAIKDHDVVIVNSGWWELKEDDDDDHRSDSCSFDDDDDVSDFYTDSDCLESYEDDLNDLVESILKFFVVDAEKAVIWRQVTCCGVNYIDSRQRIGAIAVGAMNAIADKVMADNSIDTVAVYQMSNVVNLISRTFDNFHPRSNQLHVWTQLCLNKIAKQLNKVDECLVSPSSTPSAKPAPTLGSNPTTPSPSHGQVPSASGTSSPTAHPATAAPMVVTPRPTKAPYPWPTKHPTEDPNLNMDSSGYDMGEDVREASRSQTLMVGNQTFEFTCFSSNDGITYKNKPALDLGECPTAGQKVLLAIFIASLASYVIALMLKPPGTKGSSLRAFQASASNSTGPSTASKTEISTLEDELSNSALQVLRQMEDIEVRSGPSQLASVAECKNESCDFSGKGSESCNTKVTASRAVARQRSSAQRSGLRVSSIRDGSHHAPRTSVSLVNKTLSVAGASVRTSSYAEPHLDPKVSSVAFSFYDGGDSDDEEVAPINAAVLDISTGSKHGQQARETARTALEFAFLLTVCVVGEHRMPSGFLPAGTTIVPENPDLWSFIMVLVFLVSLLNVEVLEEGTEVFLSRAQANEWKGWMQVAFVAYHYTNNNDVYVPIRWCVSAYVWLTGFGNGVYFWSSGDFSFKRFAQQLWRMNFLCLFLSLSTGTPWIEYYFVALATVHFTLIWVSLGLARAFGHFVAEWEKPDKKESREACYVEKALGCGIMIGLCCLIWLDPHNDGEGVYDVVFRPSLLTISEHTEWYFWMRTKMDFLSSLPGLCFAVVYTPFRDSWPYGISRTARWCIGLFSSLLFAAAIWISQLKQYCCNGGADYRTVNPYIGTLWIPVYLLLRNCMPWLSRRIMKPIEWIGMHSLEFYLLQFHIFLTSASHRILYIIPKESWGYTNMCIVGCIYFVVVIKALEVTNVLRNIAWRASRRKVILSTLWTIGAYTTLADANWDDGTCSRLSWVLWLIWCAIVTGLFAYWTIAV